MFPDSSEKSSEIHIQVCFFHLCICTGLATRYNPGRRTVWWAGNVSVYCQHCQNCRKPKVEGHQIPCMYLMSMSYTTCIWKPKESNSISFFFFFIKEMTIYKCCPIKPPLWNICYKTKGNKHNAELQRADPSTKDTR